MSDKPFTFEEFKKIYSQVPRLCIDIVVRNSEGTLLTLRKIPPHKGQWHLPGGTLLFKEPIRDAIQRIAKNELGISVEVGKFLGYIEFMNQDEFGGFDHPISLLFLCSPKTQTYKPDEQSESIQFFRRIPNNTIKEHKEFLENPANA